MLNDSLRGFAISRWGSVQSLVFVRWSYILRFQFEPSRTWNTGAFVAQFPTGKAYYVRQINNSRVSMVGCSQTLGWLAASDGLKAAHVTTCLPRYCSGRRCPTDLCNLLILSWFMQKRLYILHACFQTVGRRWSRVQNWDSYRGSIHLWGISQEDIL